MQRHIMPQTDEQTQNTNLYAIFFCLFKRYAMLLKSCMTQILNSASLLVEYRFTKLIMCLLENCMNIFILYLTVLYKCLLSPKNVLYSLLSE